MVQVGVKYWETWIRSETRGCLGVGMTGSMTEWSRTNTL